MNVPELSQAGAVLLPAFFPEPQGYILMITVTDSGGAAETSVIPFRVAGG